MPERLCIHCGEPMRHVAKFCPRCGEEAELMGGGFEFAVKGNQTLKVFAGLLAIRVFGISTDGVVLSARVKGGVLMSNPALKLGQRIRCDSPVCSFDIKLLSFGEETAVFLIRRVRANAS